MTEATTMHRSTRRAAPLPALASAFASTLALSGCMSFIPEYQRRGHRRRAR